MNVAGLPGAGLQVDADLFTVSKPAEPEVDSRQDHQIEKGGGRLAISSVLRGQGSRLFSGFEWIIRNRSYPAGGGMIAKAIRTPKNGSLQRNSSEMRILVTMN